MKPWPLYISKGKMAGTAKRSLGMMETERKRWNKQRWGRRERDENIFFCALLAVLHSSPIISPSCAESLMFNYWKHSSSPSPAKQYPAYISSRQHLTDGNIKIWCQVEGAGAWSGRADGSKWAWAQLIVTITKPLVGNSICQEPAKAEEHQINIALTLTVSGKMCHFHLSMDIKAGFIFI